MLESGVLVLFTIVVLVLGSVALLIYSPSLSLFQILLIFLLLSIRGGSRVRRHRHDLHHQEGGGGGVGGGGGQPFFFISLKKKKKKIVVLITTIATTATKKVAVAVNMFFISFFI